MGEMLYEAMCKFVSFDTLLNSFVSSVVESMLTIDSHERKVLRVISILHWRLFRSARTLVKHIKHVRGIFMCRKPN